MINGTLQLIQFIIYIVGFPTPNKMKFLNKQMLVCFIASMLVCSCTKLLETDFPDYTENVVLNGMFCPDSVACVHVSLSGNLSDTALVHLPNATVVLHNVSADTYDTLQHHQNGWYAGRTLIQAGSTYTCTVFTESHAPLTKQTTVPYPPRIIKTEVDLNAFVDSENGSMMRSFSLTFPNDKTKQQYYDLLFYYTRIDVVYPPDVYSWEIEDESILPKDTIKYAELMYINPSSDVVFVNEPNPLTVFCNKYMQGTEFTVTGIVNGPSSPSDTSVSCRQVELRAVSPEYYHYMKQAYVERYSMNGSLLSYASTVIDIEI